MNKPLPAKGERIVVHGMREEYAKALVVECAQLTGDDAVILIEWPNAPGASAGQVTRVYAHDEGKIWYRYGQNN